MATYVYSDPHFDSEKIIVNGQRPFQDVAHMNRTLIERYNATVKKQDICYWLGDVMYGASKEKVSNILRQLHGRKYLILGNHDRGHSEKWWLDAGFDKVFSNPVYIAEQYIMLSHEPLPEFGELHPIANIHGHIHIMGYDFDAHSHCINVSVEETDYKPILMQNPFLAQAREFSR